VFTVQLSCQAWSACSRRLIRQAPPLRHGRGFSAPDGREDVVDERRLSPQEPKCRPPKDCLHSLSSFVGVGRRSPGRDNTCALPPPRCDMRLPR
jgi:hypothetical protein